MRCEPAEGPDQSKCKRCRQGGHECIFEESQRGRRKNQKTDAMARALKNMESTLETVLKSINGGLSVATDGTLVDAAGHGISLPLPTDGDMPFQQVSHERSERARERSEWASGIIQAALTEFRTDWCFFPLFSATFFTFPRAAHRSRRALRSPISHLALPIQPHTLAGMPGFQTTLPASTSIPAPMAALPPLPSPHQRPPSIDVVPSPAIRLPSLPDAKDTWAPLGLLAE